jgi:hypothetical protein
MIVFTIGVLLISHAARAATFTVTNSNNAGPGSLRDAITQADINPPDDTIVFDLPGPGPHGIFITSGLALSSNLAIVNDRAGDELVAIQRANGSPDFRIFTVNSGLTVTLSGLILANGQASTSGQFAGVGGGILNNGSNLTLRSCTLSRNTAAVGGAIYTTNVGGGPDATLTMTNCLLMENTASGNGQVEGGAIFNTTFGSSGRATATLTNCVFRQNSSGGTAGGVGNQASSGTTTASMTLTNCTFSDNTAGLSGGGVYNASTEPGSANIRLENCTLEGNQSGGGGGAVEQIANSRSSGRVTLSNCTVSGNSAGTGISPSSGGAGIRNTGGTVSLTNCTFASNLVNSAGQGQSVQNLNSGLVSARNTLFVRNGLKGNFSNEATFSSRGHNLANDAAGGDSGTGPGGLLDAPGDIRNTNPLIVALADNGGPTQTRALQAGSPAINAGDDTLAPDADQRGYLRNHISDIGAFEVDGLLPPSLANISTRLRVETGDNVLIGGFIITGTEPKRVIVRAIGPSLPFADRLQNPTLELRDGFGGLVGFNDNWVDSPDRQAIIDTTVPPANDFESAIVATLPANNSGYTAIVRGANNGTGIGVVEAYDLDRAIDSKLANISTRGLVQTGDNILIAGTIVGGQSSQRVIIRAIGPSLPVAGKLGDPTLELRDGNGAVLAANDNWRTGGQEAQIIATTIPPADDFESAIVFTLPANNAGYTAIVRGAGDTTGIAVVEVYELD